MTTWLKFNINQEVKVKLTDYGHKTLRNNHEKFYAFSSRKPEYHPPTEDADGFSKWQLWELMHEFGNVMYNGGIVPFETEILLEQRKDEVRCTCAEWWHGSHESWCPLAPTRSYLPND